MREPEPVLVVDLFPLERQHLLQLLAQLREEESLARKVFDTVSIIA